LKALTKNSHFKNQPFLLEDGVIEMRRFQNQMSLINFEDYRMLYLQLINQPTNTKEVNAEPEYSL